jgi:hypothetical protein
MGRRSHIRIAAVTLAALAICGCGSSGSNHEHAVLATARAAVRALADGRVREACAYLTPHGRRRSLGFRIEFDDHASLPLNSPRIPQTCEGLAARERKQAENPRIDNSWLVAARSASFRVTHLAGRTATVRVSSPYAGGMVTTLVLKKTRDGWRIDDSPAVPNGH